MLGRTLEAPAGSHRLLPVKSFWQSVGPVLDLVGWIGLAAAGAFFVWAAVHRAGLRRWSSAPCRVEMMDAESCLVWNSPDGTVHTQLFPLHDGGARPERVYFRKGQQHRWQVDRPADHSRLLERTGYTFLGLCLASNVLGLVGAAA